MIKPMKDKDGNYIPLDTAILHKDNGDAVAVIGYYCVIPLCTEESGSCWHFSTGGSCFRCARPDSDTCGCTASVFKDIKGGEDE